MKDTLLGIWRIIRVRQWIKNLFVLLPVFFGGALTDAPAVTAGVVTLLAFSLAASSIYCLNDIVDVEADRRHPVKCHRPVASGQVGMVEAWTLMVVMLLLSLATVMLLDAARRWQVGVVVMTYYVLNVAYCVRLKDQAIVDVCLIAFGFVLRILAGGLATDIQLSKWIVLMTFLLTLFLSLAKRRDDVLRMEATGVAPRKNTIRYNLTFINQAVTISGSVMLVCYIMYTVSPEVTANFHTDYLYLTSAIVLVGLLRYIQIAVVDKQSGDPTKVVLRDRAIQAVVVAWLLVFLIIIYIL